MASRRTAARARAMTGIEWLAEWRGAATLAALGLFVLAMAGFADGSWPPVDTFRSMWIPIGVGLMLSGVVLLVLRAWRGALALLAGAVFIALPVKVAVLDGQALTSGSGPTLSVLTINALVTNPNDEGIAAQLIDGGYDIVAVQEAPMLWDAIPGLAKTFPYRTGCETPQTCDLLLLSRHPLDDIRWTPFDTRAHRMVTARTTFGGRTLGVAATHLTKPHHDGTQRYEMYRVVRALDALPSDAVLMGDFNSAPWTGLLGWLRGATGFRHIAGYRPTAPVRLGPLGIPIDHVMTRGRVGVSRIAVLDDALGSNHFGVEADLHLPPAD